MKFDNKYLLFLSIKSRLSYGVSMALINCPECSTEVSSKADKCPRCGHPINTALVQQQSSAIAQPISTGATAQEIGQEVVTPLINHDRRKSGGGATGALIGAALGYGLMWQSCHMEWVEWNFVSTLFVSMPLVLLGMLLGYFLGKAIA
jgi:hypothetical protein